MKNLFVLLICLIAFSCENEDQITPIAQPQAVDFIIGATGGWGGSHAFRIVDGQLQRSVRERFLGDPETIANETEFTDYTHEDAFQLRQLITDFPAEVFEAAPFKFDCEEQAWDGQCTYIIRKLSDGTVQYWTRSEFDQESEVTDFLDRTSEVLYSFYE